MKFSIRLNNDLPVAAYARLAAAAENAGFDQFWISNDLMLRSAPVLLASLAHVTRRIQLGTCILNPYTMDPSEIAMFASSMDELTGNRFNLGLAAGAGEFLKWVGLPHNQPLRTLRECIQLIRALQVGERAELEGRVFRWGRDAYLRFAAPRQTPIYLGAMSEGMLKLAGELCDGALPLLFPPEHYFSVHPIVQQGRAIATTARPFDFAACIWVSIDADRAAARRALAAKIAYYGHALGPLIYGRLGVSQQQFRPIEHALMSERDEAKAVSLVSDDMLNIGVVGDADDLHARLKPLLDAGATHLSFGPPLGPDPLQAIEYLGEKVLPRLRPGAG